MKYSAIIEVVQGDDMPLVRFQIKDKNTAAVGQELSSRFPETWAPVNLGGAVVYAQISSLGADTVIDQTTLGIIDSANGKVQMNIGNLEFIKTVGVYEVEVTVVYGGSQQTVYDRFKFDVRKRISDIIVPETP